MFQIIKIYFKICTNRVQTKSCFWVHVSIQTNSNKTNNCFDPSFTLFINLSISSISISNQIKGT